MAMQNYELILLIPLVVLIVQDFRSRTISIVWLILLATLSITVSFTVNDLWKVIENIGTNLLLLFYLAIGILIYIRIKRRRWINPLKEYIGAGDIVFLLSIMPLFELRSYLLFLICTSSFSLIWMLASRLMKSKINTIPFVTTMSIPLSMKIIIMFLL